MPGGKKLCLKLCLSNFGKRDYIQSHETIFNVMFYMSGVKTLGHLPNFDKRDFNVMFGIANKTIFNVMFYMSVVKKLVHFEAMFTQLRQTRLDLINFN